MIEVAGREEEWWRQRIEFLVSRAAAHQEESSEVLKHRACAATLLRDAGCLLLLRQEVRAGREHLVRAGELLLEIGLGAGLLLVAMGDAGRGREELQSYRGRVERALRRAAESRADSDEDWRESVALAARGSFGSLLSVVQTDLLAASRDAEERSGYDSGSEQRVIERRELLERHGNLEVGETGMTVFRYLGVAAGMKGEAHTLAGDDTGDVVRAVELLGRRREERIESAMRDEFHWRLVPRPAELLDLDSVLLMLVALVAGYEEGVLREWTGWGGGDVIGAPLDVAAQLRGSAAYGPSV